MPSAVTSIAAVVAGSAVVSVLGAIILLVGGLLGLVCTAYAAKPVRNPTRRYTPLWVPAMVITELAPFWLLCNLAGLALGLLLGGWDNPVGRVGAILLTVSAALLLYLIGRSAVAVRRLRRLVDGVVHPALGRARLVGRPAPTPPGVVEQHGVSWRPGLTLDLTRPAAPASAAAPVFVYVHGGGWTGGDPQHQARDLYHALALDGWVVVAVRYPFTPSVMVEEQIEVVRDAVRWVRRSLIDHGVIAEQVVLGGGSAGGHLAAMAALTAEHPDERVDACVGIYGVYDMANRTPTRAHWHKIHDEVMLQTVAESPERYRSVSPVDRITDQSPPMLVVHGTGDTLVPVGEGELFVRALLAAGRPVDFVPVLGAQHAFDALSSRTARTTAAVVRDWARRTVLPAPIDVAPIDVV
jgi:acetyl esterase/lipase